MDMEAVSLDTAAAATVADGYWLLFIRIADKKQGFALCGGSVVSNVKAGVKGMHRV